MGARKRLRWLRPAPPELVSFLAAPDSGRARSDHADGNRAWPAALRPKPDGIPIGRLYPASSVKNNEQLHQ